MIKETLMGLYLASNILIAFVSIWFVLSHRVKTSSIEILALFLLFVTAMTNLESAYFSTTYETPQRVVFHIGVAMMLSVRFYYLEVKNRIQHGHNRRAQDIH